MQTNGMKTTAAARAREIMGRNFFGVEEAVKGFKLEPAPAPPDALVTVPFSERLLEESKDTHLLVAVLPLSILDLRGKVDRTLFYNQTWYRSGNDSKSPEAFAQAPGEPSWQLVRKTAVPGSASKNWDEQLALLGADEEVPEARVMIYARPQVPDRCRSSHRGPNTLPAMTSPSS